MSHFRIAERLLDHLPGLDARMFVVGNVAPDSGRPNHDWTSFDPPKTVTHFLQAGEDEGRIRDLSFFREFVGPLSRKDNARFSFMLGYFTHLVTDNLWMYFIGHSTQTTFAAQFAEDRSATWERVKDDWYGLDHKYLRDFPDNVFGRLVVDTPNPPSPVSFLPTEALAYRLDDLREFYGASDEFVLDRDYPYLSETTMNRVIEDCVSAIQKLLARLGPDGPCDTDKRDTDKSDMNPQVSLQMLDLPLPYTLP